MNVKIPLRNAFLQRRRYYLLAGAIAFGFAVVTLFGGASAGFAASMREKAARYFSGHVDARLYAQGALGVGDLGPVAEAIRASGVPIESVSVRSIAYSGDSRIFFAGDSVPLRRVIGVDFAVEAPRFAAMPFAAGGAEDMGGGGGILISQLCAATLGAKVGDDLTLFHQDEGGGAIDAVQLAVRGIFRESSIFGYAAYVTRDDVNRLLRRPKGSGTDVALYLLDSTSSYSIAETVRRFLGTMCEVFPPIDSRKALDDYISSGLGLGIRYAVMSVDAQMSDLGQLLDAIGLITWAAVGAFALIIAVGISNSYRMIMNERMRELGTMRAMGMTKGGLRGMFVLEALAVATAGALAGLVAGNAALAAVGALDLSWIPGSGLFLDDGRVRYAFDAGGALRSYAMLATVACLAAFGPVFRASRMPPVRALRGE